MLPAIIGIGYLAIGLTLWLLLRRLLSGFWDGVLIVLAWPVFFFFIIIRSVD